MQLRKLLGHELKFTHDWHDQDQEGLCLKIDSDGAFQAHVVVRPCGSENMVAVASLIVNGLTGKLIVNSIATNPEVIEFYNFTTSNVGFYSHFGDDLCERVKAPHLWMQESILALEKFYELNWPALPELRARAGRFLAKQR